MMSPSESRGLHSYIWTLSFEHTFTFMCSHPMGLPVDVSSTPVAPASHRPSLCLTAFPITPCSAALVFMTQLGSTDPNPPVKVLQTPLLVERNFPFPVCLFACFWYFMGILKVFSPGYFSFFFKKLVFREGGREEKRHRCERRWLIWETSISCPRGGIPLEPTTFSCSADRSNPPSHTGQGSRIFYVVNTSYFICCSSIRLWFLLRPFLSHLCFMLFTVVTFHIVIRECWIGKWYS